MLVFEPPSVTPPAGWGDHWRQVHPAYVTRFGPDASVIGPPPGWEEYTDSRS
jgi:hypothetical protein